MTAQRVHSNSRDNDNHTINGDATDDGEAGTV
jgi:hypothetical protein